jgi:3',5'-cyclic AMP phosphodiesterase CpdA
MMRIVLLLLAGIFISQDLVFAQIFKKGPYLQDISQNSVRIIWETDSSTKGRVIYGYKGSMDKSIEESSAGTLHNILIEGLMPDKEYEYQVEGESRINAFRTLPSGIKPVKFIVYGDNRTNLGDHQKVVDAIIKEKPLFVINTGDLVESGLSASDYQKFFEIERELLRGVCIFPTIGNHEVIDPTLSMYKKYFFPPQRYSSVKEYYSFDFANVHIVVLNSYDGLFTFSNEQIKWLENDLATATKSLDHIFSVMHHGPYSASNHGDNAAAKSKIVPILKKYNVDMTIAGHDHNYERGEADGLRYMVAGGGGAPLYSSGQSQYTIYSESVLHYVVFNVYGPDVSGCAYRVDGSVMDCFNWSKGSPIQDAGYGDISADDLSFDTPLIDTSDIGDDLQMDTSKADTEIVDTAMNDTLDAFQIVDTEEVDAHHNPTDVVYDIKDASDRGKDIDLLTDISLSIPDTKRETQSDTSGCSCLLLD